MKGLCFLFVFAVLVGVHAAEISDKVRVALCATQTSKKEMNRVKDCLDQIENGFMKKVQGMILQKTSTFCKDGKPKSAKPKKEERDTAEIIKDVQELIKDIAKEVQKFGSQMGDAQKDSVTYYKCVAPEPTTTTTEAPEYDD